MVGSAFNEECHSANESWRVRDPGISFGPVAQGSHLARDFDLVALDIFPDDQPVEQHVKRKALAQTGSRRAELQVGGQKLARHLRILIEIFGRYPRQIGLAVAEIASHEVEGPADLPSIGCPTQYYIAFLVVLHREARSKGYC